MPAELWLAFTFIRTVQVGASFLTYRRASLALINVCITQHKPLIFYTQATIIYRYKATKMDRCIDRFPRYT